MGLVIAPPRPEVIYVPVRAEGHRILDNGNDVIATCINPIIAAGIAMALNKDAYRG